MRALRRLLTAATTVALVAGWLLLAPTSLGGSTTYVTTNGNSMEPGIHAGDLALIRSADRYRVGDAVAHHSDMLDTTVLHRIVAVDEGVYTLQGDNNSWLDPDQPTEDNIVGALALRIPQGGVWLDRITSPTMLALLVLALTLGGGAAARTRRRNRRRTVSSHVYRASRTHGPVVLPAHLAPVAYGAAIMGALALLLGVLAWGGPSTEVVTDEVASKNRVTFSYTAQVPRTPAYDDTTLSSPDPVFRKLAQTVEVAYAYVGEPGRSVSVSAELSASNGWRTTLPLAPDTSFDTGEYDGTVVLDLRALDSRTSQAAKAIGLPMDQVTVTVRPRFVTQAGEVFQPELPLSLTSTTLTLADTASLESADTSTTLSETSDRRTLSLLGRNLAVDTARVLSVALLAGALLAAVLLLFLGRSRRPATEGEAIRRRYASMLVRVEPTPVPAGRSIVDVTDMATLVKLAERYGLLVLHWSRANVDTFLVQDEGTTYRYRTDGSGVDTGYHGSEQESGIIHQ